MRTTFGGAVVSEFSAETWYGYDKQRNRQEILRKTFRVWCIGFLLWMSLGLTYAGYVGASRDVGDVDRLVMIAVAVGVCHLCRCMMNDTIIVNALTVDAGVDSAR